ncbi:hypothetical protein [Enterobacter ludwigii]|uniref:hypothetical protein n=1 Tax=Enterobacter ludwigii TaxID=299767 RepID=UPI001867B401|nr:hypothetical protein [Enterobacter ludwigii]
MTRSRKRLAGFLLLVTVLAGCQARTPGDTAQATGPGQPVPAPEVRPVTGADNAADHPAAVAASPGNGEAAGDSTGLTLCRNDLNSLKQVNEKAWQVRQKDFSALVAGASVYARVRGDVNGNTRDTLDALYRYKTNQLCARIERDVLDGLVVRGESIK